MGIRVGKFSLCSALSIYLLFSSPMLVANALTTGTHKNRLSPLLASVSGLWEHPVWLKLLHYEKNLSGTFRSRVDDPDFFLDPSGDYDPRAEFLATVLAFTNPDIRVVRKDQWTLPPCKYPARFAWLSQWLSLSTEELSCPDYDRFYKLIFPEHIWYVFSSYYLNNPSSSFGHSLLRFERKPRQGEKHNSLLDHGVNFAAVPDTENPLLYAIKGLSGNFQGHYSILPYYFKVREYSDFESRDLWSYRLNLSRNERRFLVQHLWELGGTYFDYYFFTENCSYQLLALLEVAKPDLNLIGRMPFWIIPSETVRIIAQTPSFVTEEKFRPSLYRKYKTRKSHLSPAQKTQLKLLLKNHQPENIPKTLSTSEVAEVLDTALDFTEFKNPSLLKKEEKDPQAEAFKFRLLKARASLNHISRDLQTGIPLIEKPDIGHGTARSSIGFETTPKTQGNTLILEQRFAYHDFLDDVQGYPPHALIEFMNISANISSKKTSVDRLSILKIQSLKSFTGLEPEPSWQMEFGAQQADFRECQQCSAAFAEVGIGIAKIFGDEQHSLSTFLSAPMYFPLSKENTPIPGASVKINGIFQLRPQTKMIVSWKQSAFSDKVKMNRHEIYGELRHKTPWSFATSGFLGASENERTFGAKIFYYY